MSGRAVAAAVATLALLLAGCGSSSGGAEPRAAEAEPAGTTTAPTTTTEPPPPGGRRPTADDPLRVLLAGDSLMADISLAITSTLNDGGRARARLIAAPSVPRDEVARALWRDQLQRFDPEVIVILIGVWEGMAEDALALHPLGSPAWERIYRRQALLPYLELLTSRGAEVVWIGMPPALDLRRAIEFVSMNGAVRNLAEDRPNRLTYIPGDELLAGPDGGWADILPGPHGTPQRVRRLDTTHLCAEGAVMLARPVLRHIERRWDVPLARNWPHRDWRWVFPPEDCPPP